MEKKIIVPVDFSDTSHNAYLYARKLAQDYPATLELLHVYNETPGESEEEIKGEVDKLKIALEHFANRFPVAEEESQNVIVELKVSIRILRGLPVKSILSMCENPSTTMIVMGLTGKHNAYDRFWGTISSSVAQKANCPVLLIPKAVSYAPFRSILYASNFESADQMKVEQMKNFAQTFGATIHFIHVEEQGDSENFLETERRIFKNLFAMGDPTVAIYMQTIFAESVVSGLNDYAKKQEISLITLVNNQRGFLDNIIGRSLTKKMVLNTNLPLMVFHLP